MGRHFDERVTNAVVRNGNTNLSACIDLLDPRLKELDLQDTACYNLERNFRETTLSRP